MALPKDQRLRKDWEFQQVFGRGKSIRAKHLNLLFDNNLDDPKLKGKAKLGVIVSKKTELRANRRNLWKRRIQEAFRELSKEVKPGVHIVLQAKKSEQIPLYCDIKDEIRFLLLKAQLII